MIKLTAEEMAREIAIAEMKKENPSALGCVYDAASGKVEAYTTNEPWQDGISFDVSTTRNDGRNEVFNSLSHKWTRNPKCGA